MNYCGTGMLKNTVFATLFAGLFFGLVSCSGGNANAGIVEKNGKLFLNKKINSLVDEKLRFVISSVGSEIGEIELKNGFLIASSYKYSVVDQGRLDGFSGPETECIGFAKDSLSMHPDDKGSKQYYLLCRALESFTGKYRSYTSTVERPVEIENNQLFYVTATGKSGPVYRAYYDVRLKPI